MITITFSYGKISLSYDCMLYFDDLLIQIVLSQSLVDLNSPETKILRMPIIS